MKTLIIIPSRLSATRLPGKPLLKINGLSMISHVFKKAEKANIGEVVVATEDQEIMDDVKKNGGQAILTQKKHFQEYMKSVFSFLENLYILAKKVMLFFLLICIYLKTYFLAYSMLLAHNPQYQFE